MHYPHNATLHTAHGRVALRLARADRFGQRLIGLIGHPWWQSCPPRQGLWLPDCRSVHGLGVGAPLQLLFCIDLPGREQCHRIVATDVLRPGGLCTHRNAQHTLELGQGSWHPGQVQAGDWWEWHP